MKRTLPYLLCSILASEVIAGTVADTVKKVALQHTASTIETARTTTYEVHLNKPIPGWNMRLPLLFYTTAKGGSQELALLVSKKTSQGIESYLFVDDDADERPDRIYRGRGTTYNESRHNLAKNAEEVTPDEEFLDAFSYAMATARNGQ